MRDESALVAAIVSADRSSLPPSFPFAGPSPRLGVLTGPVEAHRHPQRRLRPSRQEYPGRYKIEAENVGRRTDERIERSRSKTSSLPA